MLWAASERDTWSSASNDNAGDFDRSEADQAFAQLSEIRGSDQTLDIRNEVRVHSGSYLILVARVGLWTPVGGSTDRTSLGARRDDRARSTARPPSREAAALRILALFDAAEHVAANGAVLPRAVVAIAVKEHADGECPSRGRLVSVIMIIGVSPFHRIGTTIGMLPSIPQHFMPASNRRRLSPTFFDALDVVAIFAGRPAFPAVDRERSDQAHVSHLLGELTLQIGQRCGIDGRAMPVCRPASRQQRSPAAAPTAVVPKNASTERHCVSPLSVSPQTGRCHDTTLGRGDDTRNAAMLNSSTPGARVQRTGVPTR
jgi:hypothetical protein